MDNILRALQAYKSGDNYQSLDDQGKELADAVVRRRIDEIQKERDKTSPIPQPTSFESFSSFLQPSRPPDADQYDDASPISVKQMPQLVSDMTGVPTSVPVPQPQEIEPPTSPFASVPISIPPAPKVNGNPIVPSSLNASSTPKLSESDLMPAFPTAPTVLNPSPASPTASLSNPLFNTPTPIASEPAPIEPRPASAPMQMPVSPFGSISKIPPLQNAPSQMTPESIAAHKATWAKMVNNDPVEMQRFQNGGLVFPGAQPMGLLDVAGDAAKGVVKGVAGIPLNLMEFGGAISNRLTGYGQGAMDLAEGAKRGLDTALPTYDTSSANSGFDSDAMAVLKRTPGLLAENVAGILPFLAAGRAAVSTLPYLNEIPGFASAMSKIAPVAQKVLATGAGQTIEQQLARVTGEIALAGTSSAGSIVSSQRAENKNAGNYNLTSALGVGIPAGILQIAGLMAPQGLLNTGVLSQLGAPTKALISGLAMGGTGAADVVLTRLEPFIRKGIVPTSDDVNRIVGEAVGAIAPGVFVGSALHFALGSEPAKKESAGKVTEAAADQAQFASVISDFINNYKKAARSRSDGETVQDVLTNLYEDYSKKDLRPGAQEMLKRWVNAKQSAEADANHAATANRTNIKPEATPTPKADIDTLSKAVGKNGNVSESSLQKTFGIGPNQASGIIDDMEASGLVSPPDKMGNRTANLPTSEPEAPISYASKVLNAINGIGRRPSNIPDNVPMPQPQPAPVLAAAPAQLPPPTPPAQQVVVHRPSGPVIPLPSNQPQLPSPIIRAGSPIEDAQSGPPIPLPYTQPQLPLPAPMAPKNPQLMNALAGLRNLMTQRPPQQGTPFIPRNTLLENLNGLRAMMSQKPTFQSAPAMQAPILQPTTPVAPTAQSVQPVTPQAAQSDNQTRFVVTNRGGVWHAIDSHTDASMIASTNKTTAMNKAADLNNAVQPSAPEGDSNAQPTDHAGIKAPTLDVNQGGTGQAPNNSEGENPAHIQNGNDGTRREDRPTDIGAGHGGQPAAGSSGGHTGDAVNGAGTTENTQAEAVDKSDLSRKPGEGDDEYRNRLMDDHWETFHDQAESDLLSDNTRSNGHDKSAIEDRIRELIDDKVSSSDQPKETPKTEAVKAEASKAKLAYGKSASAITPDMERIPVTHAIVEASAIHTSDQPGFPKQYQNRNRDKVASRQQIDNIARNPISDLLSADHVAADTGTPVIEPKNGYAIAGNGRTIGLRKAYQRGNAEGYRQHLIDNAAKYGIDPEAVRGMKEPIHVRFLQDGHSDARLKQLADSLNRDTKLSRSAGEVATGDVGAFQRAANLFKPSETGDVNTAENRPFIMKFLSLSSSEGERGALINDKGVLTKAGVDKVKNAVFSAAYGDPRLVENISEDADSNIKNVGNALLATAGKIAKLKDLSAKGFAYDLDIGTQIAEAAKMIAELRSRGESLEHYEKAGDLFGDKIKLSDLGKDIFDMLEQNKRSSKKISDVLKTYVNEAIKLGDPRQRGIFEADPIPTKAELFQSVLDRIGETGNGAQASLFENKAGSGGSTQPNTRSDTGTTRVEESGGVRYETPADQLPSSRRGGAVRAPNNRRRSRIPGAGVQLDLFAPRQGVLEARSEADDLRARFSQEVEHVSTGMFVSGSDRVSDAQEAARVLMPMSQSPQESIIILVLDKNDAPLRVARMSLGTDDATLYSPHIFAGVIHSTPGVAKFYIAHNHPSGNIQQSKADVEVTESLRNLVSGTGVKFEGHLIIGDGSARFLSPDGTSTVVTPQISDTAANRLPIQERRFSKKGKLGTPILNESDAHAFLKNNVPEETAVILFDHSNAPIAIVPITEGELLKLRTRSVGTGASKLLAAMEKSGASGMIVKLKGGFGDPSTRRVFDNISSFANGDSLRLLDVFANGVSARMQGMISPSNEDFAFMSKGKSSESTPALDRSEVDKAIKSRSSTIKNGPRIVVGDSAKHISDMTGASIPANADGVLHNGIAYVNAANMTSHDKIERTLAHETIGHYGIERMLNEKSPAGYQDLLDRVSELGKSDPCIKAIQEGVDKDYKGSTEQVKQKETVARAAEENAKDPESFTQRAKDFFKDLLARFRAWLRNKFPNYAPKFNYEDLASMLRQARDYVHGGRSMEDLAKGLRGGKTESVKGVPAIVTSEPSMSKEPVGDTFYSQMGKVLEQKLPGKATGPDIAKLVDGWASRGEFKKEELEWSGLKEWLQEQKGSVTKEAIVKFLRNNQIQVKEIEKSRKWEVRLTNGNETFASEAEAEKRLQEELNWIDQESARPYIDLDEGTASVVDHDGERLMEFERDDSDKSIPTEDRPWSRSDQYGSDGVYAENEAELEDYLSQEVDKIKDGYRQELSRHPVEADHGRYGSTRYQSYSTPGGDDYKELLLTLPSQGRVGTGPKGWGSTEATSRPGDEAIFRSSHWEEPNVLAHVRFDTRTDANGKKTLFIQEIQSDWHQAGKKEGYVGPELIAKSREAKRIADEIHPALEEMLRKNDDLGFDSTDQARVAISQEGPDAWEFNTPEDKDLARRYYEARMVEREFSRNNASGIPDAPFKTTWPMLAFKRMIRWAAENGFDKIAWTTGEQQADRYNLSKQVKRIGWHRKEDGLYNITAIPKDDDGRAIIRDNLNQSDLEALIGRDLTKRIVNDPGEPLPNGHKGVGGKIEGNALKIGGEGMKGFYDQILPAEVNKYVKKWGARVGETKITAPSQDSDRRYVPRNHNGQWRVFDYAGEEMFPAPVAGVFASHREAQAHADELNGPDLQSAHSIDVTPQMARSALQGQPLFSKKPPETDPAKPKTEGLSLSDLADAIRGKNRPNSRRGALDFRKAVDKDTGVSHANDNPVRITDREALKRELGQEEKASQEGAQLVRKAARDALKFKEQQWKTKMDEAMSEIDHGVKDEKKMRQTLINLAKSVVPKEEIGRVIQDIQDAVPMESEASKPREYKVKRKNPITGQMEETGEKRMTQPRPPANTFQTTGLKIQRYGYDVRHRNAVDNLKQTIADANPSHLLPEFRDAIQRIVDGTSTENPSTIMRSAAIAVAKEMKGLGYDDGNLVAHIDQMTKDAKSGKSNVYDMMPEQIDSIRDAISEIADASHNLFDMMKKARRLDAKETAQQAANYIADVPKTPDLREANPVSRIGGTIVDKLKAYKNQRDKPALTFLRLGPDMSAEFSKLKSGQDIHHWLRQAGEDYMKPVWKRLGMEDESKQRDYLNEYVPIPTDNGDIRVRRDQFLDLLGHLTSHDTYEEVKKAGVTDPYVPGDVKHMIPPETLDMILRTAPEKDLELVREWKQFLQDVVSPAINKVSARLAGREIAVLKDYWPRHREWSGKFEPWTGNPQDDLPNMGVGNKDSRLEGLSSLKERVSNTLPVKLQAASGKFSHHLDLMGAYVGLAEPIKRIRQILDAPVEGPPGTTYRKMIDQRMPGVTRKIDSLLNMLSGDTGRTDTAKSEIKKAIHWLARNYAGAELAFRPLSAIKHAFGFQQFLSVASPEEMFKALSEQIASPAKSRREYLGFIQSGNAPTLRARSEADAVRYAGDDFVASKYFPKLEKAGHVMLREADLVKATFAYIMARNRVAEQNPGMDMKSKKAMVLINPIARDMISEAMNSMDVMDRSWHGIENRGDPAMMSLTTFMGPVNGMVNQWDLLHERAHQEAKENPAGATEAHAKAYAKGMTMILASIAISALAKEVYNEFAMGKKNDKKAQRLAKDGLESVISMAGPGAQLLAPLAGDLLNAIVERKTVDPRKVDIKSTAIVSNMVRGLQGLYWGIKAIADKEQGKRLRSGKDLGENPADREFFKMLEGLNQLLPFLRIPNHPGEIAFAHLGKKPEPSEAEKKLDEASRLYREQHSSKYTPDQKIDREIASRKIKESVVNHDNKAREEALKAARAAGIKPGTMTGTIRKTNRLLNALNAIGK